MNRFASLPGVLSSSPKKTIYTGDVFIFPIVKIHRLFDNQRLFFAT